MQRGTSAAASNRVGSGREHRGYVKTYACYTFLIAVLLKKRFELNEVILFIIHMIF